MRISHHIRFLCKSPLRLLSSIRLAVHFELKYKFSIRKLWHADRKLRKKLKIMGKPFVAFLRFRKKVRTKLAVLIFHMLRMGHRGYYSIVKDNNVDFTVGNWKSKKVDTKKVSNLVLSEFKKKRKKKDQTAVIHLCIKNSIHSFQFLVKRRPYFFVENDANI